MRYTRVFVILTGLLLILSLAGCSGRPTEIIQATEQARQDAVNAHADQFATDYWSQGEKSWQDASALLEAQKWGEAQTALLKAKSNYIKARDMARQNGQIVIDGIKTDQTRVTKKLAELKSDPGVSKLSATRRKEFDAAVKQYEDELAKAGDQLKNANFTEAGTQFKRTERAIWETQQDYLKK